MSTTWSTDGMSVGPAPEPNTTNVKGPYYDHSYRNYSTNITVKSGSRTDPLDRLLGHVAHGAVHDSAERGPDAPKCHPETRIAVQKDIMGWIEHGERDDAPKRILWLSGPAGSGKTAIAGTIADECYKRGLLAASFFFSAFAGSANRRVKKLFIHTLVYRLIQHKSIVGLKEEVLAVIENDPGVFERHLDQQLEELILKPLRKVAGRSNRRDWPLVIIIDGLDECQGHSESDINPGGDTHASGASAQKEVLSALSRACTDPAFPFRIIVASRPEPVIRHFFSTSPYPTLNIFLDDKYNPDSDICLFLEAMFSDIRRRFNLPSIWASKDVVDVLVKEASGQFIYAATVIRFLDNPRLGPPQQLLTRLLEWRKLNDSKPFAPLDLLYDRILRTSPDPLLAVRWIRFVNDQRESDYPPYAKYMLECYSGETEHVLGTSTSLVGLVGEGRETSFRFYHKSLLDFLVDPHRSSDLHVNDESLHRFIRERYYHTLQARGPQFIAAERSPDPKSSLFLSIFYHRLAYFIDPCRRYTSGDVEWWLLHHDHSDLARQIPQMFASIHEQVSDKLQWLFPFHRTPALIGVTVQCKWYRCLPACGVWRKGILRHCREHSRRVPTTVEMLRERFGRHRFDIRDYFGPLEGYDRQ